MDSKPTETSLRDGKLKDEDMWDPHVFIFEMWVQHKKDRPSEM